MGGKMDLGSSRFYHRVRDAGILTITDMTLESRPCKKDHYRPYPFSHRLSWDARQMMPLGRSGPRGRMKASRLRPQATTSTTRATFTTTTTTKNAIQNDNNN